MSQQQQKTVGTKTALYKAATAIIIGDKVATAKAPMVAEEATTMKWQKAATV